MSTERNDVTPRSKAEVCVSRRWIGTSLTGKVATPDGTLPNMTTQRPSPRSMADARTRLRQADASRTAGRRMISRGERPFYHVEVIRATPDIGIRIMELPWLVGTAPTRRDVTAAARSLIAAWLDVPADAIGVDLA